MSEMTLTFGNAIVNNKEFHASKQAIDLNLEDTGKIVVSDKFKHNDKGFKDFIDYTGDETIRPLCIVLPQLSGYIKYFDDSGKIMYFKIKHIF